MSETTARYRMPYILAAQAQKHVTHNEALRALDHLTNMHLITMTGATAPETPSEGECHVVGTGATRVWTNHEGEIAAYVDNAWQFHLPFKGLRAFSEETGRLLRYDGSSFVEIAGGGGQALLPAQTDQLGISTAADADNRLAVRSPNIMLKADDKNGTPSGTGDIRIKINKDGAAQTASLLFQNNYSGRAEMGCAGSDDFQIRVSPDGSAFNTAMQIDRTNRQVGFNGSADHALSVHAPKNGAVSRMRIRNQSIMGGSGASLDVAAGQSHMTQFLQYANGSAYLVTSSASG